MAEDPNEPASPPASDDPEPNPWHKVAPYEAIHDDLMEAASLTHDRRPGVPPLEPLPGPAPMRNDDPVNPVAAFGDADEDDTPGAIFAFPMAEITGDSWRQYTSPDGEWRARPNSYFDGNPLQGASATAGRVLSPPWAEGSRDATAEDEESRGRAGQKVRALVREVVETGLLALLVFLSVRATFQNFKVDGTSMFPTLENNEFLIVNKLLYATVDMEKLAKFVPFIDPGDEPIRHVFHPPQRGDIIVLKRPNAPEMDLIKRVIGLPGDTIEVEDGRVIVNDQELTEPYIVAFGGGDKDKFRLPEGEYFVMGDNRGASSDSRSFGPVPEELIIGRAVVTYWPTDKFGFAPNEAPTVGAAYGAVASAAVAPVFGMHSAAFLAILLAAITATRVTIRGAFRFAFRRFR